MRNGLDNEMQSSVSPLRNISHLFIRISFLVGLLAWAATLLAGPEAYREGFSFGWLLWVTYLLATGFVSFRRTIEPSALEMSLAVFALLVAGALSGVVSGDSATRVLTFIALIMTLISATLMLLVRASSLATPKNRF